MSDVDRMVQHITDRQHGAVSCGQAARAGMTRERMRRRVTSGHWLRADVPKVFLVAAHPRSWEQQITAVLLWAGDDAVLSHGTAARLWGLDGYGAGVVSLTVPTNRRLRSANAHVHRSTLSRPERTRHRGFPVTSPERTLIDIASTSEVLADEALESMLRLGLTSPARLAQRIEVLARHGRPGSAMARRLVASRGPGRARGSVLEGAFLRLVRTARLPKPARQFEVGIAGRVYYLDFGYPAERIAIELDGWEAHGRKDAFQRDRTRQNHLVLAGWMPLRFTWDDVHRSPDRVVATLRAARSSLLASRIA